MFPDCKPCHHLLWISCASWNGIMVLQCWSADVESCFNCLSKPRLMNSISILACQLWEPRRSWAAKHSWQGPAAVLLSAPWQSWHQGLQRCKCAGIVLTELERLLVIMYSGRGRWDERWHLVTVGPTWGILKNRIVLGLPQGTHKLILHSVENYNIWRQAILYTWHF